jgi:hypothetical protein
VRCDFGGTVIFYGTEPMLEAPHPYTTLLEPADSRPVIIGEWLSDVTKHDWHAIATMWRDSLGSHPANGRLVGETLHFLCRGPARSPTSATSADSFLAGRFLQPA